MCIHCNGGTKVHGFWLSELLLEVPKTRLKHYRIKHTGCRNMQKLTEMVEHALKASRLLQKRRKHHANRGRVIPSPQEHGGTKTDSRV